MAIERKSRQSRGRGGTLFVVQSVDSRLAFCDYFSTSSKASRL